MNRSICFFGGFLFRKLFLIRPCHGDQIKLGGRDNWRQLDTIVHQRRQSEAVPKRNFIHQGAARKFKFLVPPHSTQCKTPLIQTTVATSYSSHHLFLDIYLFTFSISKVS